MTGTIRPFRAGAPEGIPPEALAFPQITGPHVLMADCSEFQPDIADPIYLGWSKAIVIRAAYGENHDDHAWYGGQRRALLHENGVKFLGIYQYLRADQDPVAQAMELVRLVGSLRPGEKLIADLEEGGGDQHGRWSSWASVIHSELGDMPWDYSGRNYAAGHGLQPVDWIADYSSIEPQVSHKLWQFTDSFPVPGVGTADCSVWHGDIDQLAALACQPAKPAPPAGWTYGAPVSLHAAGGHTTVALEWQPPHGAPVPPDHYVIYLYEGDVCDTSAQVATYPRTAHGLSWEGGGLERGKAYTAHVVASGPGRTRVRPMTFASARFRTG
jgi:hypothetical protein